MNINALKVKLKSLAAEARIIRKEELKCKGKWAFHADSFRLHRTLHIRPITRATHIAYGLLRGLEYREIEPTAKRAPDWTKVSAMVNKYSEFSKLKANRDKLNSWVNGEEIVKAA